MTSLTNEPLSQSGMSASSETLRSLSSMDPLDELEKKLEIEQAITEHEFKCFMLDLDHFTEKLKKRNDEIERM